MWRLAGLVLLVQLGCGPAAVSAEPPEDYMTAGNRALEWTRRFVALGPRPAGSPALEEQGDMISNALKELPCRVEEDRFVAATPVGALSMRNIIARFGPPDAPSVIIVSGHYDTLRMERFVGANDGGSSAGFLMALAERVAEQAGQAVWIVFFDGEESTRVWRDNDHTYGSRRLAGRWSADGTAHRIRALINVDMIGDADLHLMRDGNSERGLQQTIWNIASELGYESYFDAGFGYIEDDHVSFIRAGIPAVDLIDFEYGPGHSYWHTEADTMEHLSGRSLAVVLHVVETAIDRLQAD